MGKILNTKNLIYFTIVCTPLYLVRFEIFAIPTNILELLIGLTFISWISDKKNVKIRKIDIHIALSILLILLGLLFSTLLSGNYKIGFGIIKGWFIFPLIFGLIIYSTTHTKNNIDKILNTIFLSSFLVSIISLFYYFLGNLTFDERLSAFYLSPNYLAMFIAPGLLIGAMRLLNKKNSNTYKLFLIIGSLIILLATYLTNSYASWLSILISYLLTIVFLIKNSFVDINYRILFLISFFIITSFFIFQQNNSKFHDLINLTERSSLSSRIMIWKSSFKILSDNLIFGIGPGNFQEKYLEYQKYFPLYLEWAVPQPHNLYLAFWLQGGLLGIIGFLLLIYIWIKKQILLLKYSNNEKQKQLATTVLVVIIYFLIHGLVDTTYWKNDFSLIFWVIAFTGLLLFRLSPYPKQTHSH